MKEIPVKDFKMFLSHRDGDEWLKHIEKACEDIGIVKENIIKFPDDNVSGWFPEQIKESIDNCDLFFCLITEYGGKSEWVNQEIGYAVAKEKDIVAVTDNVNIVKGMLHKNNKTFFMHKEDSTDHNDEIINKTEKALTEFIEHNKIKLYRKYISSKLYEFNLEVDAAQYYWKQIDNNELVGKCIEIKNSISSLEGNFTFLSYYSLSSLDELNELIKSDMWIPNNNIKVRIEKIALSNYLKEYIDLFK